MNIDVSNILSLQAGCTDRWHSEEINMKAEGFYQLVEENHQNNFELWHEEDKARRDDCGFEYVYQAKRNIDRFNQQRNDAMEAMDQFLFETLNPAQENCPMNSETPAAMIDRLSILSLKEYHMRKQVEREDASDEHRENCQKKSAVINMQIQQLANCLDELLKAVVNKARSFRMYYQFKMYNDPVYRKEGV